MRNDIRRFLLLGCALVVYLELPYAIPTVRAAFAGPYPVAVAEVAPAPAAVFEERVLLAGFLPLLSVAIPVSVEAPATIPR